MAIPATRRIKSVAAIYPVPQNKEEASDAIHRIGLAQRERDRIQADMNDALAKLKLQFEDQAKRWNEQITALSSGVQTWCEANREALTKSGKVKYYAFAAGEVNWRMRPQKVTISGVDSVLETLKRLSLARFIRTKEEPNKEAMLNEPEAVTGIAGIKISQGEDFVVKPFETELEEVA